LSDEERLVAPAIYRELQAMQSAYKSGVSAEQIEQSAFNRLEQLGFEVDYAEIRAADLGRLARALGKGRVALIAARLGRTRLIDNLEFDID